MDLQNNFCAVSRCQGFVLVNGSQIDVCRNWPWYRSWLFAVHGGGIRAGARRRESARRSKKNRIAVQRRGLRTGMVVDGSAADVYLP
jgi:hypothetical protein